jgi:hypothetical protein
MTTATAAAEASVVAASVKKALELPPAPNSDFCQLVDVLTAEERAIVTAWVGYPGQPLSGSTTSAAR